VAGETLLPAIYCPFDSAISPLADAIDQHAVAWARHWELAEEAADIKRIRAAKIGRLAARTTPGAGARALEFLADWQMWLFVFDDTYSDESPAGADLPRLTQSITAFLRVLDNGGGDDTDAGLRPFTRALADLVRRLTSMATAEQVFRFVSAVRGYFLAQFWEAGHRVAERPAGLQEYVAMRRHSGAVPTCMALIDVANGFELGAAEYYRPAVRAITDIAVNVTCWANDILSYPKEMQRSLQVHSLPVVLARERQLPVRHALATAAAMHDAEVAHYLAIEDPLRRTAGPFLRRYLDGLRAWIGGNFHWSMETGRYQVTAG
jgi:hypothetical protein